MEEKFVKLQDLWYTNDDVEVYCFHAFGLYDDENVLLQKLYYEIENNHEDYQNKQVVLDTILERFQLIGNNREYFAHVYGKKRNEIKVRHHLTRMLDFGGKVYQFLTSDITVPLSDSFARFVQPPLCFIVSEDFKTWSEIVPLDEKQCATCAETSGLNQFIQDILRPKSQSLSNESKPSTSPSVSSV